VRAAGADVGLGVAWADDGRGDRLLIDCRGLAAQPELPKLRGVRGERLVVRSRDVVLTRPMRLLHPRHPIYIVPWSEGRYMVGATVIESEDARPLTVRSALELLGSAYALHPALGEAEILEAGAGVRPAFPDNVPKIIVRGRTLYVNGLYRHGFLLAPVLAELLAGYVERGEMDERVFVIEGK
jgi:glycine oxidase